MKENKLKPKYLDKEYLSTKIQEIQEKNFEKDLADIPVEDILKFDFNSKEGIKTFKNYFQNKMKKSKRKIESERQMDREPLDIINSIGVNYDGSKVFFHNSHSPFIFEINTTESKLGIPKLFI